MAAEDTAPTGGSTTVPGIGKVKKTYVYVGMGLAAGVVAYAYWRNRQNAAAAAATPTVAAPTGSYVNPDPSVNSGAQSTNSVDPNAITTNAEWTQHALDLLGQYTSVDTGAASVAIGTWFSGGGLTGDQKTMIITALGLAGDPPDLSQWGGTLPPMHDLPAGTPPPPSNNPPPTQTQPQAKPGVPANVHVVKDVHGNMTIGWNPVTGAQSYAVAYRYGSTTTQTAAAKWSSEIPVNGNTFAMNVTPNMLYDWIVRAVAADGTKGDWPTSGLWVRTAK